MEWNYVDEGINAIIIDGFYSKDQLTQIWNYLDSVTNDKYMTADKDALEAAIDLQGNYITTKYGLWIDDVTAPLVKCAFENFSKPETQSKAIQYNPLFRILFHMNRRFNLLSYYENSGYYSKHKDSGAFTILNYFHREPKQFSGGHIVLHSYDFSKKVTVEPRNNRVVIIPGCTVHEVTPIEMTSKILSGNGRYCYSIFLTAEDVKELRNPRDIS